VSEEPDGTENISDDEIFRMRCAACKQIIGFGTKATAKSIGLEHAKACTASREEYEQAVIDVRFSQIVAPLMQEWEQEEVEDGDDE